MKGYSILELCTVILMVGLLACFAIPLYDQFLMREEREIVLQRLEMAIEYAKQTAFIQQKIITICPSIDHKTCSNQHWSHGFIIIERGGKRLKVFPKLWYGTLQFNQFGTDLNIYPNGTTPNNGTFFYFPRLGDRREIGGLVVNNIGRTYRTTP